MVSEFNREKYTNTKNYYHKLKPNFFKDQNLLLEKKNTICSRRESFSLFIFFFDPLKNSTLFWVC